MNEVLENIRRRRSVRRFLPEPLPPEALAAVIEAGRQAPCGGNNRTTHFMVIQNQEVLEELRRLAVQEFAKMEVTEDTYRSLKNAILSSKKGTYVYDYRPPSLVVVANRAGYRNAMADCSCALENMMLAAFSLDIGSCWINQLHWLDDNPVVRAALESWGLGADETVCGALALGYPAEGAVPKAEGDRGGNPVTYI